MGKLVDLRSYRRFRSSLEKHLAAYRRYPDYHCRRLICKMAALAAEEFGVKQMVFPRQRAAVVDGRIVVRQPRGWYKAKGGASDVS
jgi:hypothetical protein